MSPTGHEWSNYLVNERRLTIFQHVRHGVYSSSNKYISSFRKQIVTFCCLAMFEIWRRLNQLKLDKVVCSLLMVLILINPDRNMPPHMKCELEKLNTIQEQYIEALQVYFEKKYRRKASTLLGHSMSILSNLRDISARSLAVQLGQLHKMGKL